MFQMFTTTNNAVMNSPAYTFLGTSSNFSGHVPVDRFSKAGLQDILNLLDTEKLLSKAALQFTLHNIPIGLCPHLLLEDFNFCHSMHIK